MKPLRYEFAGNKHVLHAWFEKYQVLSSHESQVEIYFVAVDSITAHYIVGCLGSVYSDRGFVNFKLSKPTENSGAGILHLHAPSSKSPCRAGKCFCLPTAEFAGVPSIVNPFPRQEHALSVAWSR